jgi:4-amino-4-deoxy-L-arabinose transferase-like glycosyltransferase
MLKFPLRDLLIILLIAAIGRALLLASGAVSFHSDEAVVALMARHINQGARPVFFYGQVYMGSLDAWLVAIGFRLFGESVLSIRLVQSVLYLLIVTTSYLVGWQFSGKRIIATVTALMFALPSALVATYTTATLGGYNEVLLFGNLILIAGWRVLYGSNPLIPDPSPSNSGEKGTKELGSLWDWALLGIAAGLGWWANGLIVVYALPVALLGLWELIRRVRQRAPLLPFLMGTGIAGTCFFIGSAPWWLYNFQHDFAALNFYLTGAANGRAELSASRSGIGDHALGMLLFGIPTVFGMRFSWLSSYFLAPVGLIVISIYALAIYRLVRVDSLRPGARGIVLLLMGLFCVIFVVSPFGADPTGRYFLPLVLPLGITLGTLLDSIAGGTVPIRVRRVAPLLIGGLALGYPLFGQISAVRGEYGLTTQFDLLTHIPNDHDVEVIEFLKTNDLQHGQTNYWVAYRLAFLSSEQLQYNASLPYKADLSYNAADRRYKPYTEATQAAERLAYITTKLPELDAYLQAAWQDIAYETARIGEYVIYYNFSAPPTLPPFD